MIAALGNTVRFVPAAEPEVSLIAGGLADRGAFVDISTGHVSVLRQLGSGTLSASEIVAPAFVGVSGSNLAYSAQSGELFALKVASGRQQLVRLDTHAGTIAVTAIADSSAPLALAYRPEDRQLYVASRPIAGQFSLSRQARAPGSNWGL